MGEDGRTEVGFYHCTRRPALDVAVQLAARAWEARQRLLIVAEAEMLDRLDRLLWVQDPASFLPHGRAGAGKEAEQPILLADAPTPENGATLLMLVEAPLPDLPQPFARAFHLFDDGSAAHRRARAEWKALAASPHATRAFWKQTPSGRWEKQA